MSAKRITKGQLVAALLGKVDGTEAELKKLTVKKLQAVADEHGIEVAPEESVDEGSGEISDEDVEDILDEGREQFEYLQDKDPSPKQEFYATMITELTGIDITPKQYQAMISTHRFIQASDLNRARSDYRPRSAKSVIQAAETLMDRADKMVLDDEGAVISKSAHVIPEHVRERVEAILRSAHETEGEVTEQEAVEAVEAVEEELADA